ncbi:RNA binding protein [Scophthalmus maximus]|uniref:RNA binding protein n=1 Tax=Scophthalmus maximus TaxID=52904 RepID=A0A2U9C436_SCOMX|nr:RNA binding protein [Scophthalmus maximus]
MPGRALERKAEWVTSKGAQKEDQEASQRGTTIQRDHPEARKRGTAIQGIDPEARQRGTAIQGDHPEAGKRGTAVQGDNPKAGQRDTAVQGDDPECRWTGPTTWDQFLGSTSEENCGPLSDTSLWVSMTSKSFIHSSDGGLS